MSAFGNFEEVAYDDVTHTSDSGEGAPSIPKVHPEQNYVGAPQDKEEAETKAREHGYTAPIPYDYSTYEARGKTEGGDGGDMQAPASVGIVTAQAARYEWQDEYGEIGPKIPELEAILFSDEHRQEAGLGRHLLQGMLHDIHEHNTDKVMMSINSVSFPSTTSHQHL